MPMFLAGSKPDDVAGMDLLPGAALDLYPAAAGRNNQSLAERMRVPGRASAGLEGDDPTPHARRPAALKPGVDPHRAGEILRRPPLGGLRAAARDLHSSHPVLWRQTSRAGALEL